MSSFTTPLAVEILTEERNGRTLVSVIRPFEYYDDLIFETKYTIKVPKGFISDFASVPRPLWVFFPPLGPYAKAAVIHDYMVVNKQLDYKQATQIFYNAMNVLNVPKYQAEIMYFFVLHFGPRW